MFICTPAKDLGEQLVRALVRGPIEEALKRATSDNRASICSALRLLREFASNGELLYFELFEPRQHWRKFHGGCHLVL